MGKYDPLTVFLRRQKNDVIDLDFADIERRIGALLPKAAQSDDWWNGQGVQGAAWTAAGFVAERLRREERVRFRRGFAPASS